MAGKIFISYRRDDAKADARSLYQQLSRSFGARRLFMDVDTIEKGRDFALVLNEHLAQSTVLLAVIGPKWLTMRTAEGLRRLDDPGDFVRLEIAAAFNRDIAVIPVLVDGARLPTSDELSADLKPLARRQAVIITHENFKSDANQLERDLKRILLPPSRFGWKAAIGATAIAAIAAAALVKSNRLPWPIPGTDEAAAVVEQPVAVAAVPPERPFDIGLLPAAVATEVQKAREAQKRAIAAAEEGCKAGDKAELAAAKAQTRLEGYVILSNTNGNVVSVYMGEPPTRGAYGVVSVKREQHEERYSGRNDEPAYYPQIRREPEKSEMVLNWGSPRGIGRVRFQEGDQDATYCGRVTGPVHRAGRTTWSNGQIDEVEGEGIAHIPQGYGVRTLADGRRAEGFFNFSLGGIGVIWSKDGRVESAGRYEDGKLVAPMEGK